MKLLQSFDPGYSEVHVQVHGGTLREKLLLPSKDGVKSLAVLEHSLLAGVMT